MPDVEQDDYFEISADEPSAEDDFLMPDSGKNKKRRRKYVTGKVEKKNKRKEKLPPKLLFIRHTVIALFLALALGALLLFLTLPLLKGWEEKKVREASVAPPFHFSIEEASPVVDAFLQAETLKDIKALCLPSPTLDLALRDYLTLTEQDKPQPAERPTLVNDHFPAYITFPTDHAIEALYIRESEGEHRVDLEASIGFNPFTIDALNTFSLKTAENVRVNLFPLPAEKGDVYTRVEGRFPYDGGKVILYYRENTPTASTIDYELRKKPGVPVILDLSLYDLQEPRRYFISSLKSLNWILKNN